MSAFSSFCVPEVEWCGPVRVGDEALQRLPVITQVGVLDLSLHLQGEKAPSGQPPCLQHIIASRDSAGVCCVDADSTLILVDVNQLKCTYTVPAAHSAPVTSCCFLHHSNHILLTSSQDGAIKLWDLREQMLSKPGAAIAEAAVQIAPSGSREADMWALAVRGDDQVFAASFKNYIKGYDIRALSSGSNSVASSREGQSKCHKRSRRLLWDLQVHGDVVTALQFHPVYPQLLVSGGEDSLICISDTNAVGRDSSDVTPVACFSQERAVKGLSLLGPGTSCVCIRSAMEDVGLWQVEGLDSQCNGAAGDGISVRRRAEWLSVRSHPAIREGDSGGYVVDVFYDNVAGRLFILAGSVSGRLLLLHANLDGMAPAAVFKDDATFLTSLAGSSRDGLTGGGGHTGVVRGAASLQASGCSSNRLLTCGEDGRICAWRQKGFENDFTTDAHGRRRHVAAVKPY